MSEFHALFRISGPNLDRDEITVTTKGFQVGRSGDNDLTLPHSEISRQHMRIFPHDNGFAVEDLKSSNGVWVNDVRIRTETPHPLKPGDVLRAGPFLFTFDRIIEVGVSAPAPAAQVAPSPEEIATMPPAVPPPPPAEEVKPEPPASITAPPEPMPPPPLPPAPPPAEASDSAEDEKPAAAGEEKPAKPAPVPFSEAPPREQPRPIERVERVDLSAFVPRTDGDALARIDNVGMDGTLPPVPSNGNGHAVYPIGIPTDTSNWLQYLPAIYSEDQFIGRYLLIFESIMSPLTWMVDNFDMYLSPEVAPSEWLRWIASWFDVMIVPELPIERQRNLVQQLGWLFSRRGTRAGLERLLTLYYGVKPDIIENEDNHFTVRMPLSDSNVKLERDILDRLIMANKPAHAAYTLEIE